MQILLTRAHRVVLGDVDSAGVIYFATVFRWHEQSLSECLATRYRPLSQILKTGNALPVVECSANYPLPIHQDDQVTLSSWAGDAGRSSFHFMTNVLLNGVVAASVRTKHVWTRQLGEGGFAAEHLSPALREAFALTNTLPTDEVGSGAGPSGHGKDSS